MASPPTVLIKRVLLDPGSMSGRSYSYARHTFIRVREQWQFYWRVERHAVAPAVHPKAQVAEPLLLEKLSPVLYSRTPKDLPRPDSTTRRSQPVPPRGTRSGLCIAAQSTKRLDLPHRPSLSPPLFAATIPP